MIKRKINLIVLLISIILCIIFKAYTLDKIWMLFAFYFGIKILGALTVLIRSLFININKEYDTLDKFTHFTYLCIEKAILDYSGARIHTSGLEKLPKDHRYLIVFNHTSKFDPILMNSVIDKEPIIHISKPENFKIFIGGPFMIRECNLSFKRDDLKYNAKVALKAANYIKEDKFSVGLAPEGTRNKIDPSKLLPFHEGVFKIPLKSHRDLVICEIRNTEKIAKNFPFKKTDVYLNILDVFKYDDYKDMNTIEISSKVYNILQNKINSRK